MPKAFQREFPNIRVELTEGSNGALHQALLKGSVDLAIADFPGTLPGVRLRELCREEIVLLMQKDFFAATFGAEAETRERQLRGGDFSALRDCPLVLGGAEDIDGRIARAVLKRGGVARPVIRATSHNVGTLLRLCLCGAGACFCPNNILRGTLTPQQADGLLLFELGEDAGSISLIALSPDGRFGAATTRPCFPFAAARGDETALYAADAGGTVRPVRPEELDGVD